MRISEFPMAGPGAPVSLVALSDGDEPRPEKRNTWREDWDRRMADLSKWERDCRRFKRAGVLWTRRRACEKVARKATPAGVVAAARIHLINEALAYLRGAEAAR